MQPNKRFFMKCQLRKLKLKTFFMRLGYKKKRASLDDDYLCHVEVEKTKIAWVRILITNRVSMNVSAKSIHTAAKIIVK